MLDVRTSLAEQLTGSYEIKDALGAGGMVADARDRRAGVHRKCCPPRSRRPDVSLGAWLYLCFGCRVDDAAKQAEWLAENAVHLPYTAQLRALAAALQGRSTDALALLATVNIATLDGHHTFHLSESYAMAGDIERAKAAERVAQFDAAFAW